MYQNVTENAMVSYSFYLQASIFPMKFVTSYLKKFIGGGQGRRRVVLVVLV